MDSKVESNKRILIINGGWFGCLSSQALAWL
jgi:hypothetical protein